MTILTSKDDDFLYSWLLDLMEQVKLVQGGTALASTLRRHSTIRKYMIQKQIDKLDYIESLYFENGDLNQDQVKNFHNRSLQNH